MTEKHVTDILEEIGLSDGEQKVYLTLLDLGESTSGPIAEKSRVSASKVYQVADRLIQKGLVGVSTVRGRKHFTAMHPRALVDYLNERQAMVAKLTKQAESLLPTLETKYEETARETEVQLLQGRKGLRNVFWEMVDEMNPEEEYQVFAANTGVEQREWIDQFFLRHHRRRAKKGVNVRLLFQRTRPPIDFDRKYARYRFLPPQLQNPLQIVTYHDTTVMHVIKDDPLIVRVKDKEITRSFRQYFESMWNQRTETWIGDVAIDLLTDDVLASKSDLYLIGAHGYMPDRYPKTYRRLLEGMKSRKRFYLSKENTRGSNFNKGENLEAYYLPSAFLSPMVIWIYGENVAHAIWEDELTIFRVKNQKIADDYRTYFAVLKNTAKP